MTPQRFANFEEQKVQPPSNNIDFRESLNSRTVNSNIGNSRQHPL